jgi:uncharacterized protein involved in outer membrane biogenesis
MNDAVASPPAAAPSRRRWPWRLAAGLASLALLLGLAEWRGWPFLAGPVERWLSQTLERPVRFAPAGREAERDLRVRLFGGLSLSSRHLEIAAPDWSDAPHLLKAEDARLRLRYADLWRMQRGERLRVARLDAARLDLRLERPDAQRASWQFREEGGPPAAGEARPRLPDFEHLVVSDGTIRYVDVPQRLALDAHATLSEGGPVADAPAGLHLVATGRWRDADVRLQLDTDTVLPWVEADAAAAPVAVRIDARSGPSRLRFDGSARDALRLEGLIGTVGVEGASLSQLGDLLGVTLPTTERFRLDGRLAKRGDLWSVLVDRAHVGKSRLGGEFRYDAGRPRPLLAGRLTGSLLQFADLAPAVGAPVPGVAPAPRGGRLIPDREFDLPSLRAMDANVLVEVAQVDLGTAFGEPLEPLRTHLTLTDGLLVLDDLDARSAQGRLRGRVALDGRPARPLWHAQLRWGGVALERWIRQARADGRPPYVTGRLAGRADVRGVGRSTAQMLSTLDGQLVLRLRGGTVSHLAVEAAGVDLFESLGLLIQGDAPLPVSCAVGQLVATGGTLRPRVLVVDTPDSTAWIDGTVSLASERLDLRATVVPKDFSPLTLRTPLRVRGPFADPQVSLEKGPLVRKLATTGLLAALAPLAGLIPLADTGNGAGADADGDGGEPGCARLMRLAGAPDAAPKVR